MSFIFWKLYSLYINIILYFAEYLPKNIIYFYIVYNIIFSLRKPVKIICFLTRKDKITSIATHTQHWHVLSHFKYPVSHNTLIDKLTKYSLSRQANWRCAELLESKSCCQQQQVQLEVSFTNAVTGVTWSVKSRVFGNDQNDRSDCTLSKSADHARLRVVNTNVYKYLMEGEIKLERDPSKLQTVPGRNWNTGNFISYMYIFTVKVTRHQTKLLRKAVNFQPSENLQTQPWETMSS